MDIQVGEYIRTKRGIIGKIIQIEISGQGTRYYNETFEDTIYCIDTNDNEENYRYKQQAIVKHSPNIIDLIEKDDYVNGRKVKHIRDYEDFKRIDFDDDMDDTIYEEQIYSIVTKEQYASMEYKLEE